MCTTLETQSFIAKQDFHQEEIKAAASTGITIPAGKLKTLLWIICWDLQEKDAAVWLTKQ